MKIPYVMKVSACMLLYGAVFCARGFCGVQNTGFDYKEAVAKGNGYYRENKYDQALLQYDKVIAQGLESGNIYYNMGNCYFKKGDFGMAAVYYARAEALIPRDSDLASNYGYLKSQLGIAAGSEGFAGNRILYLIDKVWRGVSIDTLTVILFCGYAGLCVFLMLALRFARVKNMRAAVVCVLVLFCVLAAVGLARKIDYRTRCAFLVAGKGEAKFEPLDAATTYFTLGLGSTVEVIETSGNWSKIRRSDGKAGWLHKDSLVWLKP